MDLDLPVRGDAWKWKDPDTKGERLELHRRMAGVVETSWSLGDIDRAIAGPASTTRSSHCTCDRRPAALASLRTVVRGDGLECMDPGMRRKWKM